MSEDLKSRFWGDCTNTFGEELKQLYYLSLMGFIRRPTWRTQYEFDGEGKSYVDIGGGPCSVLLKFSNRTGMIVDPGEYPVWVYDRYQAAGLKWSPASGESIEPGKGPPFDVALIYNCLQHCEDPAKVVANARTASKQLVMFEWIDTPRTKATPTC